MHVALQPGTRPTQDLETDGMSRSGPCITDSSLELPANMPLNLTTAVARSLAALAHSGPLCQRSCPIDRSLKIDVSNPSIIPGGRSERTERDRIQRSIQVQDGAADDGPPRDERELPLDGDGDQPIDAVAVASRSTRYSRLDVQEAVYTPNIAEPLNACGEAEGASRRGVVGGGASARRHRGGPPAGFRARGLPPSRGAPRSDVERMAVSGPRRPRSGTVCSRPHEAFFGAEARSRA